MKAKESTGEVVTKYHHKRMRDQEFFDDINETLKEISPKENLASRRSSELLNDLFIKESIQSILKEFRDKLGIPREGLEISKELGSNILNETVILYSSPDSGLSKKDTAAIHKKFNQFCTKNIPISPSIPLRKILNFWLYCNAFDTEFAARLLQQTTKAKVWNLKRDLEEIRPVNGEITGEMFLENVRESATYFPLFIGISADISLTELKSYLDKNWQSVKRQLTSEKKSVLSRKRDSVLRNRDWLIYENKHLAERVIIEVLKAEGFTKRPNIGEIGKIISHQRKVRS